ncbi:hypothetical protein ACOSQ4_007054 [Xanthoceras sorbifolium]
MDEDKKTEDGKHSNSSDDDGISLSPTITNSVEHFSDKCGGGMDNTDNRPVGAGVGGYPVSASADWPSAAVDGVQSLWVLPGADQYSIQPTHVGASTLVDLPLFKGQIF